MLRNVISPRTLITSLVLNNILIKYKQNRTIFALYSPKSEPLKFKDPFGLEMIRDYTQIEATNETILNGHNMLDHVR